MTKNINNKTKQDNVQTTENVIHTPESITSNHRSPYIVWLILFIILCLGIYLAVKPTTSTKKIHTVSQTIPAGQVIIKDNQFTPTTIKVKVGQSVIWLNQEHTKHIIASDPYPSDNALANFKEPNSLGYNDKFIFTFLKAGTYNYHDDLNPFTIQGTVYVIK